MTRRRWTLVTMALIWAVFLVSLFEPHSAHLPASGWLILAALGAALMR